VNPVELDARAIRTALFNDGYVVIRELVPKDMCEAVLEAFGTQLGIWRCDPASGDKVATEIDQVPLWGHQSQWEIRQLPDIHRLWSMVWGTERLWADRNSCRFTPPFRPGRAGPLPLHWDVDPWDTALQWFPGILALTDAEEGEGGFCCAPSIMSNRDRWPTTWPVEQWGTEYRPDGVACLGDVVEVPLRVGDLLVMDSHLPHGTVRNDGDTPRAVFYLQLFPAGTPAEAATRIEEHERGIAPEWWRWKPGHDRAEPGAPATLTTHGRRLLGYETW
jgi:Phytanoyl-CoA dioxygenase (PhyH)